MGAEVKYLGDGTAVLVVGDGPPFSTSLDGGRTLTEAPQVAVARLDVEFVHPEALYDEAPELDEAGQVVNPNAEVASPAQAPAVLDPAGTHAGTPPQVARGEVQNADQLQAEIDRLTAERDAARAAEQAKTT